MGKGTVGLPDGCQIVRPASGRTSLTPWIHLWHSHVPERSLRAQIFNMGAAVTDAVIPSHLEGTHQLWLRSWGHILELSPCCEELHSNPMHSKKTHTFLEAENTPLSANSSISHWNQNCHDKLFGTCPLAHITQRFPLQASQNLTAAKASFITCMVKSMRLQSLLKFFLAQTILNTNVRERWRQAATHHRHCCTDRTATRCSVTSLLLWEKGHHALPGHEFIFLHEDSSLVHPLQHGASFCLHLLPDFITVNTGGCFPCQETHPYLTACHPSLVNNCLRSLRHQHFAKPMRANCNFLASQSQRHMTVKASLVTWVVKSVDLPQIVGTNPQITNPCVSI